MVSSVPGEDELTQGSMLDSSPSEGWKAISESEMILKPDRDAVCVDRPARPPMLILFCGIVEPEPANSTPTSPARPSGKRGSGRQEMGCATRRRRRVRPDGAEQDWTPTAR